MQIFSSSEGMPMPNIVSPDGTATAEGGNGDGVLEGDGVRVLSPHSSINQHSFWNFLATPPSMDSMDYRIQNAKTHAAHMRKCELKAI